MNEEETISEEQKDIKRMEIIQALSELGETTTANQLFGKIEKKLEFVSLPDWENRQICSTFPRVDIKDLVFCCSPSNNCPYRAAILKKMGLTKSDYVELKKELAEVLDEILEEKCIEKNGGKRLRVVDANKIAKIKMKQLGIKTDKIVKDAITKVILAGIELFIVGDLSDMDAINEIEACLEDIKKNLYEKVNEKEKKAKGKKNGNK